MGTPEGTRGPSEGPPTGDNIDVRVAPLRQRHGRAVPLERVPKLLLDGGRTAEPVQPHHLGDTVTPSPASPCPQNAPPPHPRRVPLTFNPRRSISATHFWMRSGTLVGEFSRSTRRRSSTPKTRGSEPKTRGSEPKLGGSEPKLGVSAPKGGCGAPSWGFCRTKVSLV